MKLKQNSFETVLKDCSVPVSFRCADDYKFGVTEIPDFMILCVIFRVFISAGVFVGESALVALVAPAGREGAPGRGRGARCQSISRCPCERGELKDAALPAVG